MMNTHRNNHRSSLRIGTWNVLLQADEYDLEYGCPLQISLCKNSNTTYTDNTTNTTNTTAEMDCTRARRKRVWQTMEDRAGSLDLFCLQEVEDAFLELQPNGSSWTLIHRRDEGALFLNSRSSSYQVHATYDVSLPNLSGCSSVPMAILRYNYSSAGDFDADSAAIVVGSVHVQASVSNIMQEWYSVTAEVIRNATESRLAIITTMMGTTTTRNDDSTSNSSAVHKFPFAIVLAGDSTTTSPTTTKTTFWSFPTGGD